MLATKTQAAPGKNNRDRARCLGFAENLIGYLMEPTEHYNRSKRNLAIFATLLALVLIGGVKPEDGSKIFGFQVHPKAIPTVLFFVVCYLLYQFYLARLFQHDEIRDRTAIWIDFYSIAGLSAVVLGGYLFFHLFWQIIGLSPLTLAAALVLALLSSLVALALIRWSDLDKWRRETFALRQSTIARRLKEPGWILNYNPKVPGKTKEISFENDGSIGEGRNPNEFKWKLSNNRQLEIYREEGKLHNKFAYDAATDQFKATQPDTKYKIEGQFIYREPR
jgi:hypothetical protein